MWVNLDEIHVGFPVGADGADVAPVGEFFFVLILEGVCVYAVFVEHAWDDVVPKIVCGVCFASLRTTRLSVSWLKV